MTLSSSRVLEQKAFFNSTDILTGFLFDPLAVALGGLPSSQDAPGVCAACGGFVNPFTHVNIGANRWTCNFCRKSNPYKHMPMDAAYLHHPDVDHLSYPPAAGAVTGPLSSAPVGAQPWPRRIVLVLDTTLDEDLLEEVVEGSRALLQALPSDTLVGLVTCDSCVSVYQLSAAADRAPPGPVSATVLPGTDSPSEAILQRVLTAGSQFLMPVGSCMASMRTALDALRPFHHLALSRDRPRCLGVALEVAHQLLGRAQEQPGPAEADVDQGRIVAMMGGPLTVGPGFVPPDALDGQMEPGDQFRKLQAKKYFSRLAAAMRRAGVVVDVLIGGLNAANVALLTLLTETTGGTLILQEGFGGLLAQNMIGALQRKQASSPELDFHCSDRVEVSQIIGPSLDAASGDRLDGRIRSQAACSSSTLESGRGFAVILEAKADIANKHMYLQSVARWVLPSGLVVQRVCTRQVEVTSHIAAFGASVACVPAAVLLAKSLVLKAQRKRDIVDDDALLELQVRLGTILTSLGRTYGSVTKKGSSFLGLFGGREVWGLPPHLLEMAIALYNLKRGPMLGQVVGHSDERSHLFQLFLKADISLAQHMLIPRAFQITPATRNVEQVRPCDLILDSNTAVVLDCGNQMFVWLGSNLDLPEDVSAAALRASLNGMPSGHPSAPERDAFAGVADARSVIEQCVRLAQALSSGRFPVPELKLCREGTGDERYVISRLVPIAKDSQDMIFAQLPHLARSHESDPAYTAAMLTHIARRLPPTEEPSVIAWAEHYGVDLRGALASAAAAAAPASGHREQALPTPDGLAAQLANLRAEVEAAAAPQPAPGPLRLGPPVAERNPFGSVPATTGLRPPAEPRPPAAPARPPVPPLDPRPPSLAGRHSSPASLPQPVAPSVATARPAPGPLPAQPPPHAAYYAPPPRPVLAYAPPSPSALNRQPSLTSSRPSSSMPVAMPAALQHSPQKDGPRPLARGPSGEVRPIGVAPHRPMATYSPHSPGIDRGGSLYVGRAEQAGVGQGPSLQHAAVDPAAMARSGSHALPGAHATNVYPPHMPGSIYSDS